MTQEQKRNYIILTIVLVLIAGGIYLKNKSNTTPPNLPLSGEEDQIPPDKGENKGVEPKLTYEEYIQQGIKFETKGELNNAIDAYKKAAEISPKEYVPYSDIGSVYYAMKKYKEAETYFLKAIKLVPNNVSVYTKLYEVYYYGMKKLPDQMNAFFADAMKNTNNSIDIVKLYAFYLEKINDFESALTIWQSLLKFEPDNAVYKAKIEALQKKING